LFLSNLGELKKGGQFTPAYHDKVHSQMDARYEHTPLQPRLFYCKCQHCTTKI
jgi:hypothetical protein